MKNNDNLNEDSEELKLEDIKIDKVQNFERVKSTA